MTGEIVPGKRTIIARAGHADFDLPEGHAIRVRRDDYGNVIVASLRWGDHLSAFTATADERDDAVIVLLRDYVGSTGYGTSGSGDALPQVLPYRFPDD
jgi:hypothetical protein